MKGAERDGRPQAAHSMVDLSHLQELSILYMVLTTFNRDALIIDFTAEPYSIPSLENPETPLGVFCFLGIFGPN